jgi:VIT1/CCC1 family predicted Fe2+/Mn2+ transporter
VERELEIERTSIAENPVAETAELAAIYVERGLDPEQADRVAAELMSDPEVALDVHAREELGVDPNQLGSPLGAATASFWAFALGAFIPLVPWLSGSGNGAVWASAGLGVGAAASVGLLLARLTERSAWRTALRQMLVAAGSCLATYLIGGLLGASVA